MKINNSQCPSEEIAAYLDGQLDTAGNIGFEKHLEECTNCFEEFHAQRSFMCDLDSALAQTPELPIPQNFARIVAARAQSDMRGLRDPGERRRALRLSLLLVLTSFTLMGAATIRSLLFNGRSLAQKMLGVFDLVWSTLRDAMLGLLVVARVLGRGLVPESHLASLTALVLLVLAVLTLSHLISRYHRHQRMRLFD